MDVAAAAKQIACYAFLMENRSNPLFHDVSLGELCRFVNALEHYRRCRESARRGTPRAERVKHLELAAAHVEGLSESRLAYANKLATLISREQRHYRAVTGAHAS
jgi:hypothetical protein